MSLPTYRARGWEHWPDNPWWSTEFRRTLGETQEGGGAVGECMMVASRMRPGDPESWYEEWVAVAERNRRKAEAAEAAGNVITARNAYLRAMNYFRTAEFWLAKDDSRRDYTLDSYEECFRRAARHMVPPAQEVEIPYEGTSMPAYLFRPSDLRTRWPALIAFGGVNSPKEELHFMISRGMLERGIAVLAVDGPGQGSTLRRKGIHTRYDYEVPIAACIDYLETRADIDPTRIAVSGSSLGGYHAVRGACMDHRLSGCIAHSVQWNLGQQWRAQDRTDDHPLAHHTKWVFGVDRLADVFPIADRFSLEGVIGQIRCPLLLLQGADDYMGVDVATTAYDAAKAAGVDATLIVVTAEETGASHCQHDNVTIGEEYMGDWLAGAFARKAR